MKEHLLELCRQLLTKNEMDILSSDLIKELPKPITPYNENEVVESLEHIIIMQIKELDNIALLQTILWAREKTTKKQIEKDYKAQRDIEQEARNNTLTV
jgi:hypothetical protein